VNNAKYIQTISLLMFALLFIGAPLYFKQNLGGSGLSLPINIVLWEVATLFIVFALPISIVTNSVCFSRDFLLCLIFPVIIIFAGLSSDIPQQLDWLFRQLYIWGGVLFLSALFQVGLKKRQVEIILIFIVVSALIQSFIGVFQLIHFNPLGMWIPLNDHNIAQGMFQQPNVLATFLVTALMIILYLISQPFFIHAHFTIKLLFIITFGLSLFVVLSTGSRIGLLSFILAILVMIVSRRKLLVQHKQIMIILLLISIGAVTAAQIGINGQTGGLATTYKKVQKITEGHSIRQGLYTISGELVTKKPIFGHGIGSFQQVWVKQSTQFIKTHPQATLPSQGIVTHPHNELLLWAIEGGLVTVFSLLIVFFSIAYALYKNGFSKGGGYLALLLPITLHMQVEMPFYHSALHWFLWLFLLYIIFKNKQKKVNITISNTAKKLLSMAIIIFGFSGMAMLIHSAKAQAEIASYSLGKGGNLKLAANDIYFANQAEKIIMMILYHSSKENNDPQQMKRFIKWQKKAIQLEPSSFSYIVLSDANQFIGSKQDQCSVLQEGLAIYKGNKNMLTRYNNYCTN